jgi:uncharacterized protein YjiS (DUF1127 family)
VRFPQLFNVHIKENTMTRLITKTYEAIRDTFRFYKTVQELSQLSDRELRDLGLSRDQIPHVAADATLKG